MDQKTGSKYTFKEHPKKSQFRQISNTKKEKEPKKQNESKSKAVIKNNQPKLKTLSISFPSTPAFTECEFVNSPDDASSTCSSDYASSYIRAPGFDFHGHTFPERSRLKLNDSDQEYDREFKKNNNNYVDRSYHQETRKKKFSENITDKKKNSSDGKFSNTSASKPKAKKEPLPMKLRALPQSFWRQPNNTNGLSPGAIYPVLPPLANSSREFNQEERHEGVMSKANTDLLFSLFHNVEAQQRKSQGKTLAPVAKRGRPKRNNTTLTKAALKDEDPCLVSSVTETILPLIPPEKNISNSLQARINEGQQVLAMVTLNSEDRPNINLPTLNVDHNYSQILSELVVQL